MNQQNCYVCGRPRLKQGPKGEKWICAHCRKKLNYLHENPDHIVQKDCFKCRLLRDDQCPFTKSERGRIISCNKFVHKESERNKRRWAKFD